MVCRKTQSVEQISSFLNTLLLEHLLAKKTISVKNIAVGCTSASYGSEMDDIGIDLTLSGGMNFVVVKKEVLSKRKTTSSGNQYSCLIQIVHSSLPARGVLDTQTLEIEVRKGLLEEVSSIILPLSLVSFRDTQRTKYTGSVEEVFDTGSHGRED